MAIEATAMSEYKRDYRKRQALKGWVHKSVCLPGGAWVKLAERADQNGLRIGALIAQMVDNKQLDIQS